MDKTVKFLGGSFTFVNAAKDKIMPNGQTISWDAGISIAVGKNKVKVGKDFLNKLYKELQEEETQTWVKALPE